MPIGKSFAAELRAAGVPVDGISWDEGTEMLTFSDAVSQEVRNAAAAVLTAHDPTPLLFQGQAVFSAADVDQVTSRRILDYLAPHWTGDERMQERHILRALQDVARAQDIKRDPGSYTPADAAWADQAILQARQKDAQVLQFRQEAAAFKAANNMV